MRNPPPTNSTGPAQRIRDLNDEFRKTLVGGIVVMTNGIVALSAQDRRKIVKAVMMFSDFTADNDPYGHHDFAVLTHEGISVMYKIDCYDLNMEFASPNPSDPTVTTRVLTVMLAEEY